MKEQREVILLFLMPFWMPLIPPMGISCLKTALEQEGYQVKTIDTNTDEKIREYYDHYFNTLKEYIPEENQGNFYSIGQDVLKNHLMAHINQEEKERYTELVRQLVYHTFYIKINEEQVKNLNNIISHFFKTFNNYFLNMLKEESPTLIGFSVFSGTLPVSLFAARLIRKRYPKIRILFGGGVFSDQLAPGTPNMKAFLEETRDYIDQIIIGEGEILFLKLLKGELPGNQKVFTLEEINWEILDLKQVKPPDFTDINPENYPNMGAYTSRSCPFQCSFCSETLQWGRYRKKEPQKIVEELTQMYHNYGNQLFFFSDSLINPIVTELAKAFTKSEKSIYWDGCIRVDAQVTDWSTVFLWRKGGYYRARIGIESGSQKILDLMEKKITVNQVKEALICLSNAGIKTSTLWVIGHPGETEEDFLCTLKLIREYKDYIYDVEGTPFWYHLTGQSASEQWNNKDHIQLLYPGWAKKMLLTQTWIMDKEPKREEIYRRMFRFTRFIREMGIPNPYTLQDIYNADKRWKQLHKNAVPPMVDMRNREKYINENKTIRETEPITKTLQHDGNWGF